MNVSILGPQGSGKGTQVELIGRDFDFVVFESGRELRRLAQSDSELGRGIKTHLELGDLIPDEQIYFLTKDWLSNIPQESNILFDGCPRRLSQAKDLERLLAQRDQKIDLVLSLELSDEVAVKRLLGRLFCQVHEHVFNLETHPPKVAGICDFDGSPLVRRADETPEAIKNRLATFHRETEPLFGALAQSVKIVPVNADRPIPVVYESIKEILSQSLLPKT